MVRPAGQRASTEFDWQVLPIVAPARPAADCSSCPPHAREVGRDRGVVRGAAARAGARGASERRAGDELPADARARPARLGGRHRRGASTAWVWCRRHPAGVRRAFRSRPRLGGVPAARCARCSPSASRRPARRRRSTSSRRRRSTRRSTGSRARRPCRRRATDVLHVTAAGWSAIPAVVHKALHGTPMVLTEHGVYVREAYLAAARSGDSPGSALRRHAPGPRPGARRPTRAPTWSRPVTDANAHWEMGLGIDPAKILVLYNGLRPAGGADAAAAARGPSSRSGASTRSRTSTRCCASRPRRCGYVPDARFLHYGPVTDGRGGLRPLVPGAARAARARRPLPLHGAARPTPTASCATPTSC